LIVRTTERSQVVPDWLTPSLLPPFIKKWDILFVEDHLFSSQRVYLFVW